MSFWYAADGLPAPRPALAGDAEVDVVIVGVGYNGGWLADSITGGRDGYPKSHGRGLVGDFHRMLNHTIDEVINVPRGGRGTH